MSNLRIGVLGAGIVGVNTALQVQELFPNAEIHVIADKFYEDTLSNVAAGIFLPGSECRGPTPEISRTWIYDSFSHYDSLYRTSESALAGVMQVSGYTFSNRHKTSRNPILDDLLPVYRRASADELQICPGNWKYGSYLTTYVTTSTNYLPWALERFHRFGGKVHSDRIDSLSSLVGIYDVLMNCSGFNAKYLCNDDRIVPIRGQVFKVKAPWIRMFYYGEFETYIVPGMNIVTMGGCRNYGSYDESINKHTSADIWERCTNLIPNLTKAEVVREVVGLRPHRDQIRVEKEVLTKGGKQLKIVHNYGHGGNGVALAPGTSKYAAMLAKEMIAGYVTDIHSKL